MTLRNPPPTGVVIGPLSPTRLRRTDSRTWSGSGVPYSAIAASPASTDSHSKPIPVASRTRVVASASSGPMPSPGIRVIGGPWPDCSDATARGGGRPPVGEPAVGCGCGAGQGATALPARNIPTLSRDRCGAPLSRHRRIAVLHLRTRQRPSCRPARIHTPGPSLSLFHGRPTRMPGRLASAGAIDRSVPSSCRCAVRRTWEPSGECSRPASPDPTGRTSTRYPIVGWRCRADGCALAASPTPSANT